MTNLVGIAIERLGIGLKSHDFMIVMTYTMISTLQKF